MKRVTIFFSAAVLTAVSAFVGMNETPKKSYAINAYYRTIGYGWGTLFSNALYSGLTTIESGFQAVISSKAGVSGLYATKSTLHPLYLRLTP